MFLVGFPDIIEMLAGYAIDLTGLRNVLEKFGKFE
jgi:hypothetical protein